MLQEEPGMEMVGEAEDVEGLLSLVAGAAADLVMLDRKLLGHHARELISKLHALRPRPIAIVMSCNGEDSRIILQAGADAFVSKGDQPDWLLETLRHYTKHAKDLNNGEQDANIDHF